MSPPDAEQRAILDFEFGVTTNLLAITTAGTWPGWRLSAMHPGEVLEA
jgi:hypothetical protein